MMPGDWIMAVNDESDMIVATAMATHDYTWTCPLCGELGWLAADPKP